MNLRRQAGSSSSSRAHLSALQKVFSSGFKYFFMLAVIFYTLKNLQPMQKIMSVVIGVHKFGQKFFIIGIFWKFLYKYLKTILVKPAYKGPFI